MKKKTKRATEQGVDKPLISQVQDKWCLLKPDGTPDVCFSTREKAEEEALKRAAMVESLKEIIQKGEKGFCVMSEDGSQSFGCYATEEEAKARMAQIEQFKKESKEAAEKIARKEGENLMPYSEKGPSFGCFHESGPKDPEGKVWEVVLIEEGMSKNGRFYSREVLRDAFERKVFEGIPAFGFVYRTEDGMVIDHARDGVDTTNFPKDVVGFHKNVRFSETSPGKMGLVGEFHFMDELLQKKTLEAFKSGHKALFGFSIDAIGEGEPLDQKNVEIKYIVRANSDDIVSFPAAGGRFVRMVASMAKNGKLLKEDGSMNKKALLVQLISEIKPSLLDGKEVDKLTEADLLGMIEGAEFAPIRQAFAEIVGKGDQGQGAQKPAAAELAVAGLVNESKRAIEAANREAEAMRKTREALELDRHKTAVEAAIKESSLPEDAATLVRDLAAQKPGDAAHLKACVGRAQKLLESQGWMDPKVTDVQVGDGPKEHYTHAIEGAMAGRPVKSTTPFKSLRHMIQVVTGVVDVDSRKLLECANALMVGVVARWNEFRNARRYAGAVKSYRESFRAHATRKYGLKEAVNLAQLTEIFGDSITRQMIAEYNLPQLNDWRAVVSKIGFVDDTRVQRRERLGHYGDLATVAEGAAYVAITSPTDEEVTLSVTKYGNFEELTEEAILRNDLGWYAKIPQRLVRSALQNVRKKVWDLLLSNGLIYDGVALFAAGHANTDANALSVANLSTGRQKMRKQDAYGSTFHELGEGNLPKFLIVPPELENAANQISSSQFEPTSNLFQVANLHRGLNVIVLDHTTDADNWYLIADPSNTPTIEVDFIGDSDAPEIFTQDDPTQGSPFDSDEVKIKVRTWHGEAVLDYRGMYAGLP